MKLKIPDNKAIEILSKRIRELNDFDFQAKVWKDKTINDLHEIFSLGDTKWLQVSGLKFDTYIESEKFQLLQQGKLQAKQLLESYIEQITELSKIRTIRVPGKTPAPTSASPRETDFCHAVNYSN